MALSRKDLQDQQAWRERMTAGTARLAVMLAGRRARLFMLLFAGAFCAWQLYAFAWVPLSRETALPEGFTSVSAELDVVALGKIRDARAARLQHRPNLFSNADQYFAVSSPRATP